MARNVVVIGTQWGDEGKGKVVDLLTDHAQGVIKGHEVIEMAHGEQALGEGVGSAHGWLVCGVGWVASYCPGRASAVERLQGVFQQPASVVSQK